MYVIQSPWMVPVSGKKKFTLNKAKVLYKDLIEPQLSGLLPSSLVTPISIKYIVYPKTKIRLDLGNVCSIHQKFFEDCLTELNYVEDDSYHHIVSSLQEFGAVDKHNPRVEIHITELIFPQHEV